MYNSLELLTGPIVDIQKKYEILSDIVTVEYRGRVFRTQEIEIQRLASLTCRYIKKFLKARGK
jgi:hypothetical protein